MKYSAWIIIVTILRPCDGYTCNTHQFFDSAFMPEEKITVEILRISRDIFSRSPTVFFLIMSAVGQQTALRDQRKAVGCA